MERRRSPRRVVNYPVWLVLGPSPRDCILHDISDGGLLVAVAEMAIASHTGAVLEAPAGIADHAFWFGEDQARYVVTAKDASAVAVRAKAAGVPLRSIGATGGRVLAFGDERPLLVSDLQARFEHWLPAYMAGTA